MYSCFYCDSKFKTKEQLHLHRCYKHSIAWGCNFCDDTFDEFALYETHLCVHKNIYEAKFLHSPGKICRSSIKKHNLCCSICKWHWIPNFGGDELKLWAYEDKQYCGDCLDQIYEAKCAVFKYGNYFNQITEFEHMREEEFWIKSKIDGRYFIYDGYVDFEIRECCYCERMRDDCKYLYFFAGSLDHKICDSCYNWYIEEKDCYPDNKYQDCQCSYLRQLEKRRAEKAGQFKKTQDKSTSTG